MGRWTIRSAGMQDAAVVTVKELTQLANRRRFHLEKGLFILVAAALFLFFSLRITRGWEIDVREMGRFGRQTFIPVALGGCIAVSALSLIVSTGLIMSEVTGKRLDLLRVTAFSLPVIVCGKACAVFARAMLVTLLLLPILAASQLFGGVTASDVLKATIITMGDVFLVTALGLAVSAGARSVTDRVVRSAEAVALWLVATFFLGMLLRWYCSFAMGVADPNVLAVSSVAVWMLHLNGLLSWYGAGANFAVHLAGGIVFMYVAVRGIERSAASGETAEVEPRFKDLLGGLRNFAKTPRRVKMAARQRAWAGTLVGSQLLHSSLLAILLPLAVGLPQVVAFLISSVTGREPYGGRSTYPSTISITMGTTLLVMIAFQACMTIAREKSRHTAEMLVATECGGFRMIFWKAAAVIASQAVSILSVCVFLVLGTLLMTYSVGPMAVNVAGYAAALIFAISLGMGFSSVSRSPLEAAGLMIASLLALCPLAYAVLVAGVELMIGDTSLWVYLDWLSPYFFLPYVFVGLGLVLVLKRNSFPRVARAALTIGVALVFSASMWLVPYGDRASMWLVPYGDRGFSRLLLPLMPFFNVLDLKSGELTGALIWCIVCELLLSGAVILGSVLNFEKVFLYGIRSKD